MTVKTNYKKNGSSYYRVTATIGKDPDGKPIRKEFYGKSKKEAEAKRNDYLQDLRLGLSSDYRDCTLGGLMHLWLFAIIKPSRADNTLSRYMTVFNHLKNSGIFNSRLCDITSLDIQLYYNDLSEHGKTYYQIYMINKVLKIFFNYCISQRYVMINPCKGVNLPKARPFESDKAVDPFTDKEIKLILDGAKDYMHPIITIALATGLREGELLALTINDVDLQENIIYVNKALKVVYEINSDGSRKKVVKLGDTKTKSSIRSVPVPKNILPTLKQLITEQKQLYFKFGMTDEHQFLFTTPIATYIDPKNLQRRWVRLLKRVGVRYRKFHNIRHTYATRLFEADVNIKTIQTLLGHSSINITEKTYVHVLQNTKTDAVDKINYMFS